MTQVTGTTRGGSGAPEVVLVPCQGVQKWEKLKNAFIAFLDSMDHVRDLKINLIFSHLLAPLNVSKFRPTPTKMENTFIGLFCVLGNLEHFIFSFEIK